MATQEMEDAKQKVTQLTAELQQLEKTDACYPVLERRLLAAEENLVIEKRRLLEVRKARQLLLGGGRWSHIRLYIARSAY
jgi:hypothetical protein